MPPDQSIAIETPASPAARTASPDSRRPFSPRLMASTAASALRAAQKPTVPPLRGLGNNENACSPNRQHSAAARERAASESEKLMQAVQLRQEMRMQRIRDRMVKAEVSTSQAAFRDPDEQWGEYLAKCGSVGGKNRRLSCEEGLLRAHKTAERIFSTEPAPSKS